MTFEISLIFRFGYVRYIPFTRWSKRQANVKQTSSKY